MRPLVLSIFPGLDLLGRGFEEEGFTVVRGPDVLWGQDVREFHPPAGRFDGVIGGPPCQAFSSARGGAEPRHGNLIPEFERCVQEASPEWFLMENVKQAPIPQVSGYFVNDCLVRDVWVGGVTRRLRRFSFGTPSGTAFSIETLALHQCDPEPAATTSIWKEGRQYGAKTRDDLRRVCRLQGISEDFNIPGWTVAASVQAVVNGVPLPMARAVARAVRKATEA